ncbi:carbohydrate ABC transporter permease [Brachybacterium sp. EE-P12]|uniref:Carbohydrate ABC transporter permease n=1 Tax=Candidatus Brachybacterium intestinipullorum TaxID=2838512 RepID=A0A9D2PY92_9MICO|nr:carbohydrate ABC transporter permease [Brachybacterium sp. EE-P12]HJC69543.1 carbohydrate ABC transporter permease [Candidatus Brachybacterium intestinipullorum]
MTSTDVREVDGTTAGAPAARTRRRRDAARPVWQEPPSTALKAVKVVFIAVVCVVMLYPFVYVIGMSFAAPESVTSGQLFPTRFSTGAYQAILGGGIISRALLNSLFITVVGTFLSTLFTALLAYGLTRTRFAPGARGVLLMVLLTMLFGAGLIPNYLLVKNLGLLDSYWALILPVLISPFNMVVMRAFFMGLPGELLEAARIDGASELRIFATIVLPLSKAVIAVIALFYAVGYWNVFFNALIYINDTDKWPIQVVLNQFVVQNSDIANVTNPDMPPPPAVSVQNAVIVLATVPILCVYPFLQKYFTKGVLTGSIKG